MEAPMKLLIVGDKQTGKSSIIQCFREFDPFIGTNNTSRSTANITNEYAQMSFTG
jgi:GTPase SAR1 family protein